MRRCGRYSDHNVYMVPTFADIYAARTETLRAAERRTQWTSLTRQLTAGAGMVTIALHYDRWGSRLARIGETPLIYDRLGSRPRALGNYALEYDMLGSRLKALGDAEITYDRLGSRPCALGTWPVEYDRLGSRMIRVGPYDLTYRMLGSRIETIGPMRIHHDRLGSRPKRVELTDGTAQLSDELLIALFFVLDHIRRSHESSGSAAGGAS